MFLPGIEPATLGFPTGRFRPLDHLERSSFCLLRLKLLQYSEVTGNKGASQNSGKSACSNTMYHIDNG